MNIFKIQIHFIGIVILLFTISCSKGDLVKDPVYGLIAISTIGTEKIIVVQGDDHVVIVNATTATSVLTGKNRFRFYIAERLLLDTSLFIEPIKRNVFVLFKPDESFDLKVFDPTLNGLDKEVVPDSGLIKFSIVNLSKSLPDKVNISINTTTSVLGAPYVIRVGEFLNVSRSFSAYQSLVLGKKEQLSFSESKFTLLIKDAADQTLLSTAALELPLGNSGSAVGKLTSSTYILYLYDNNVVSILMSK